MKVIVNGIVDELTAKDFVEDDIAETMATAMDRSLKHKWNEDAQGYELTESERDYWKDVFKRQDEFVDRVNRLTPRFGEEAVAEVLRKVTTTEYPQYYVAMNEELDRAFGEGS
jgi:hypothetical protein|nr:MAG TPA: hypothetical protein [Caudoviricetes sp.]